MNPKIWKVVIPLLLNSVIAQEDASNDWQKLCRESLCLVVRKFFLFQT